MTTVLYCTVRTELLDHQVVSNVVNGMESSTLWREVRFYYINGTIDYN